MTKRVLTTLDKIVSNHKRMSGQSDDGIKTEIENVPDMLQLCRMMQYVIDKLDSLDRFVRGQSAAAGKIYDEVARSDIHGTTKLIDIVDK